MCTERVKKRAACWITQMMPTIYSWFLLTVLLSSEAKTEAKVAGKNDSQQISKSWTRLGMFVFFPLLSEETVCWLKSTQVICVILAKLHTKAGMIELLSCLVSHPAVAAGALMYLSGGQWTAPRSHVKREDLSHKKHIYLPRAHTHMHTFSRHVWACWAKSNFQCERMRGWEKDPLLVSTYRGTSSSSSSLVFDLRPLAGVSLEASQKAFVPLFERVHD